MPFLNLYKARITCQELYTFTRSIIMRCPRFLFNRFQISGFRSKPVLSFRIPGKKRNLVIICFAFLLSIYRCGPMSESHSRTILSEIKDTRDEILQKLAVTDDDCNDCEFWTVWDFDGTILHGDCTEGLKDENGRTVFKGLAELAIERKFAKDYTGESAVTDFFTEYRSREKKDHLDAYTYIVKIFAGSREKDIRTLARESHRDQYKPYYFQSSVQMLHGLKIAGIRNIVISASAEFFVQEAGGFIPVQQSDIHGIQVEKKEGILTDRIIDPVTYAEGKAQLLKSLVEASGKRIFLLAGFGNSYGTDGPFLQYIAQQKLPTGKSKVLMINGGQEPVQYAGLFQRVEQKSVLGK